MAGQNYDNLNTVPGQMGDQPQLTRDANSGQNTNFLDQTGEQVKTMAHGAADIAGGAARGAMGIAQGAALGAANMAQGAASAVKSTLGMNPDNTSNNTSLPTHNATTTHPTNTRI